MRRHPITGQAIAAAGRHSPAAAGLRFGHGPYGLSWWWAQPGVLGALRAAQAARARAGLSVWRTHVDRLQAELEALDGRALEPDVEPSATPAGTIPPSPVLFEIFERLRPATDLAESGYPRIEVVNADLAAHNSAPADPSFVERMFDAWLHARAHARRLDAQAPLPSAGQQLALPSRELLYEAFQSLDLDDPADMNRLGIPRAAAVNRRLPPGYAADPDEIADAFAEWCDLPEDSAVEEPGLGACEPDDGVQPGQDNVYPVFPRLRSVEPSTIQTLEPVSAPPRMSG